MKIKKGQRKKDKKPISAIGRNPKKLIEGRVHQEFITQLLKKTSLLITQYFGEAESKRVMEVLETGRVKICNTETFLFDKEGENDTSLTLYNQVKTIDEFIHKALIRFKKRAEIGHTNIVIKEFLFALADMLQNSKVTLIDNMEEKIKNFLMSLATIEEFCPYVIHIMEPRLAKEMGNLQGFEITSYTRVALMFLAAQKSLNQELKKTLVHLPEIKLVYPVYTDTIENCTAYLATLLNRPDKPEKIRNTLKELPSISDSIQLRNALKLLCAESKFPINIENVVTELTRIKEKEYLKTYPTKRTLVTPFKSSPLYEYDLIESADCLFTDRETFLKSFIPYFCEIQINCSRISRENIESYIDAAKILCLVKSYYTGHLSPETLNHKITLYNVKEYSLEFTKFIQNKVRRMESLHNKQFCIEIFYDETIARQKFYEVTQDHIRIISDIHADYNASHRYNFNFGDDFIINCGDTAGNSKVADTWNNNYIKEGVVIIGNHLGYSSSYPELDGIQNFEKYQSLTHPSNTKNVQIVDYVQNLKRNIAFLHNSYIEYKGIIIIGTCLYTDFELYGKERADEAINYAQRAMNDFRLPQMLKRKKYCQDSEGNWFVEAFKKKDERVQPFSVTDHLFFFHYSFNYIKQTVEEFKHKPIIVVTHHAPSPYSISEEYKGSMLNPAFASNLNKFIIDHPQIRLWCHGHCIDDQTEVLTAEGWKAYSTIKQSDKVLNYNMSTHKIEEDNINAIISKNYTGNVYHFQPKGSDIRVTDNHDMLIINKQTLAVKKIPAKELYNKKQKVIIRAAIQEKKGVELSDNLLRLLVWISADGNRPKSSSSLIRFCLYKKRKICRLEKLLTNMNILYKKYNHKDKGTSINFALPAELQNLSFKPIDNIITSCNQHQCSVILEEYAHTDGTHNCGSIIIYTSKKEEADRIQLMCITNGYGCSISKRINHGFKLQSNQNKVSYELNIVKTPYRYIDQPQKTTTIEHVVNEHFWCLNTNNGTLIIRRNGKVNITGNCHTPSDYILGETRVICCPFGYNNENNFNLPYEYGMRIPVADIKSKKSWKKICASAVTHNKIKVYTE